MPYRDFIDVYLKESRKTTNTNSAFYGKLGGLIYRYIESYLIHMISIIM